MTLDQINNFATKEFYKLINNIKIKNFDFSKLFKRKTIISIN